MTLRCLLPFPLEEAAAPGAQRRRTVSPTHVSPASPRLLTCNSSARPAPGPAGPAREVGSSSRVDGTTCAWANARGRTLRVLVLLPMGKRGAQPPESPEAGLASSRGSAGAGTRGAKRGSSETRIQILRSLLARGPVSLGCSVRHTGSTPPTKKTSSKEILDRGPGFFAEPFTITRASTFVKRYSVQACRTPASSLLQREGDAQCPGVRRSKGWRVEAEVVRKTFNAAEP